MTQEAMNSIKNWAIGIGSTIAAIFGAYEGFIKVKDSMDETAKQKIEQHTLPVVKSEINKTLDSIFSVRKVSFREVLSDKLRVDKDEVADLIADWYFSEQAVQPIGLHWDKTEQELYYIHTDLRKYRALQDDSTLDYYFINRRGKAEWCK